MRRISLTICLVLLASCSTTGTKVDKNQLNTFLAGKTTYEEVVQQLGQPTQVVEKSTGERTAMYSYVNVQARPQSFIPVVGIFAGGADAKSSTAIINFNRNNLFQDFTIMNGELGTSHGVGDKS
jgi:outer membrane protein assembly factor BamE (lipoprotein component of BamABCDE complex)